MLVQIFVLIEVEGLRGEEEVSHYLSVKLTIIRTPPTHTLCIQTQTETKTGDRDREWIRGQDGWVNGSKDELKQ